MKNRDVLVMTLLHSSWTVWLDIPATRDQVILIYWKGFSSSKRCVFLIHGSSASCRSICSVYFGTRLWWPDCGLLWHLFRICMARLRFPKGNVIGDSKVMKTLADHLENVFWPCSIHFFDVGQWGLLKIKLRKQRTSRSRAKRRPDLLWWCVVERNPDRRVDNQEVDPDPNFWEKDGSWIRWLSKVGSWCARGVCSLKMKPWKKHWSVFEGSLSAIVEVRRWCQRSRSQVA